MNNRRDLQVHPAFHSKAQRIQGQSAKHAVTKTVTLQTTQYKAYYSVYIYFCGGLLKLYRDIRPDREVCRCSQHFAILSAPAPEQLAGRLPWPRSQGDTYC